MNERASETGLAEQDAEALRRRVAELEAKLDLERRTVETELRTANRALRTLSACNQALVYSVDESALLHAMCRIVVEIGGYRLAWVGYRVNDQAKTVRPVAQAGYAEGDLEALSITWADAERGRGPTGVAIRTGQAASLRHIHTDSNNAPWRAEALEQGYASSLAVPLLADGIAFAALNIYSAQPDSFEPDEVALLTELANELAFGILGFQTREARARAEGEQRAAQQRFVDIVEFLPDATFVIDQHKRVVAWNHACEVLTGVKKEALLGQGDYVYAEPFYHERRPILIDLVDSLQPELQARYKDVHRAGQLLYGEAFVPGLKDGIGAHLTAVVSPLFDQDGCRIGTIETIRDVTEQKLVEQALRESEVKHRTLFENAGDAILVMRQDRFIDCNARTLEMFGCNREGIIGAPPYRFSPQLQPNGRPSSEEALEKIRLALTNGPQSFEWEHCRADHVPFSAKVTLNRLELGGEVLLQAIVRDITDDKQSERRLAESERKYRELVELANSIILRWTRDGRITFLNEFGQRFFGYSAEEITGRHVMDTIVPTADSSGHDLRQLMDEVCANPASFEQNVNENVRRNGDRVWIAWTNRIVRDEQGQIVEILSVGSDISARRQAEEALRELNSTLEQRVAERTAELAIARERAESADRLKSAFLATMSHELRTPLNSIIGFSGVLIQGLAGPLTEEQSRQLGMVCNSADHLLALINDVLDLSKIESGQMRLLIESFDLAASIRRVAATAGPLAKKKNLSLELDIAPEVSTISSDRRSVEQILLNLLSNGVKFTEQGRIRIEALARDRRIVISVTDTGMGIKAADLGNLFRPFTQLDAGITRKHEGTGLGLSICKRLVQLLGGTIWVRSEWGNGSTFGFELPVAGGEV